MIKKNYQIRFAKVLYAIDAKLEQAISIDLLSEVAAFSPFHFQRQFSALFGISVYKYIQLLRLKRAAYRLAFRDDSILTIALASGYEGPEAFARAFKKLFEQTPSNFRKSPQWRTYYKALQPIQQIRRIYMTQLTTPITIVSFKETRIAVLEHHGSPTRIGDTVRRFISWRKANNLPPSKGATFNLLYNNPVDTPPDQFRLDVCVSTNDDMANAETGIIMKTIPEGRCATMRYTGPCEGLNDALYQVYGQWLPNSEEELRDFPLFIQRIKFFPDVPEHEEVTDIYLPLK